MSSDPTLNPEVEAAGRYQVGVFCHLDIVLALTAALFYGVYLMVFAKAIKILRRRGLQHTGRKVLLATLCFLFVTTTAYVFAMIAFLLTLIQQLLRVDTYEPFATRIANSSSALDPANFVLLICEALNFIPGDAVIVWRVWILYSGTRQRYIPFGLVIILLASTGTSLWIVVTRIQAQIVGGGEATLAHRTQSTYIFLSLAVNTLGTLCVVFKMWQHTRVLKDNFAYSNRPSTVKKALTMLIECGLSFCCVQLMNAVIAATNTGSFNSAPNYASSVITPFCMVYAGMYPCILVTILLKQGTFTDYNTQHLSTHNNGVELAPIKFSSRRSAQVTTQSVDSIIQAVEFTKDNRTDDAIDSKMDQMSFNGNETRV
ncbi:hypothetical protein BT96DRAFT_925394 [Gymnopus androsaceus JB14]|uniref:THH1/TOM1/TOM3 domain-containing protein n=1 Tax=Gymnopus androsaceus JB14 TaxID=1447944 RepID=A0A6A4H0N1_9AGAR|nr:hypothetical protein BT96DRAFT_925394 [Gymnopus androsaceus JB14]